MFNKEYTIEKVGGHNVYVFDNFYDQPNKIFELLVSNEPFKHKQYDGETYNGKKFLDLRHELRYEPINEIVTHFELFTNQSCSHYSANFRTNLQKWFYDDFNDYKNNYWYPHYDQGYSLLVYFNEVNLLNLYDSKVDYNPDDIVEHIEPWQDRSKFNLLKQFRVPFNTAILFPADKLLHGCGVEDTRFFETMRINQAIFFQRN